MLAPGNCDSKENPNAFARQSVIPFCTPKFWDARFVRRSERVPGDSVFAPTPSGMDPISNESRSLQ